MQGSEGKECSTNLLNHRSRDWPSMFDANGTQTRDSADAYPYHYTTKTMHSIRQVLYLVELMRKKQFNWLPVQQLFHIRNQISAVDTSFFKLSLGFGLGLMFGLELRLP